MTTNKIEINIPVMDPAWWKELTKEERVMVLTESCNTLENQPPESIFPDLEFSDLADINEVNRLPLPLQIIIILYIALVDLQIQNRQRKEQMLANAFEETDDSSGRSN